MEEILKECPRHKMDNYRNYSNIELERSKANKSVTSRLSKCS